MTSDMQHRTGSDAVLVSSLLERINIPLGPHGNVVGALAPSLMLPYPRTPS